MSSQPEHERDLFLATLTDDELQHLQYDWMFWARQNQLPPSGDWFVWFVLAGRGFGKTRTGAEWVRMRVQQGFRRIALIGKTAADVRDVMVKGESGLLAVHHPSEMPKYVPSQREIVWPNGAIAKCYSGDTPDQLRGPQHDSVWCDEPQKWRYPAECFSNMTLGLRLGNMPQCVATGTPLPTKFVKELVADSTTTVTRGNTYENAANLAPRFIAQVQRKYEGTRLGRQELNGEILGDNPGALWTRKVIDDGRVNRTPNLVRIVVGVDPAVTSGEDSADTGIVTVGIDADGHFYVLGDNSLKASPMTWADQVVTAYYQFKADRVIGEINNGGDLVETIIRQAGKNVSYLSVRASRGKMTRAEPVAALYERGLVHHVGMFAELEDQMCEYVPATNSDSPDRMDALVWAVTELMGDDENAVERGNSPLTGYRG